MTEKQLAALNERFREFGTTPSGGLRFRWANAKDLFYLYENGQKEVFKPFTNPDGTLSDKGVWAVQTEWERHTHADRYGPVWMVATWVPPVSEAEWLRTVGTAFPWPRNGEYHPIDSTVLPEGSEPDEKLSQYVAHRLYQHLGMKAPDYLAAARAGPERRDREQRAEWSDIVDDVIPAFGNIPGTKEHVSFPTPSGA